jgi:hypothetical protein
MDVWMIIMAMAFGIMLFGWSGTEHTKKTTT